MRTNVERGNKYEDTKWHVESTDDIVFDAFFYEDIYLSDDKSRFSGQFWENLPESLGLSNLQYTTDYRFAFYDRDSGMFICYDETM